MKNTAYQWFGRDLPMEQGKLALPDMVARQVIWELCELGFQAEILELDHHFVPWDVQRPEIHLVWDNLIARVMGKDILFTVEYIPETPVNLAATSPKSRVRAFEALRNLMVTWPEAPDVLKDTELGHDVCNADVEDAESIITRLYCNMFYRVSGRTPTLPRGPPPRSM